MRFVCCFSGLFEVEWSRFSHQASQWPVRAHEAINFRIGTCEATPGHFNYDNLPTSPLLLDRIPIAAIMATELTVQSERAFQKQPHIFLNSKVQSGKSKRIGKGGRRWYKDVGLGFRTPKTAIEGSYIGM